MAETDWTHDASNAASTTSTWSGNNIGAAVLHSSLANPLVWDHAGSWCRMWHRTSGNNGNAAAVKRRSEV